MPSPAFVNTVNQVSSAACERLANRVWAIVALTKNGQEHEYKRQPRYTAD